MIRSIDETGPPPGVSIKKLQLVFDNEENLRAGADTFAAMDSSETPGSRVSVDTGELRVEREI
jgi:hypothetical protein